MYIEKIYDALVSYNKDISESLDDLKSLSYSISKSSKDSVIEINEFIENTAKENKLCPKCLNSTHEMRILNEVVEYQGMNVQEEFSKSYCESCGWSSED